jgi:hypothetical protein
MSDETKEIGKIVVERVLPHNGQESYPLNYL